MDNYSFRINPAVISTLKKGPKDLDSCIRLLYYVATNPAIQIQISAEWIAKAAEKIMYELANFNQLWADAVKTYPNQEAARAAMIEHHNSLVAINGLLLRLKQTCSCSGCALIKRPGEYLPRFSSN